MMTPIKIIIADDHDLVRYGLITMLSSKPYMHCIAEAATGEELVALVKEHQPDLVLTDIQMPGMGGIAATKMIMRDHPDTYVIALSMFDDKEYIIQMLEAGARGYLLKGADKTEVFSAIETVCDNGKYYLGNLGPRLATFIATGQYLDGIKKEVTLTERELEIMRLICREYSSKQIADILSISIRTVGGHRETILKKTGSQNTVGIILYALRNKLYIP